jgi:hypothetical protein
MAKSATPKLTFVLLLALLTASAGPAFASGTGSTSTTPPTSTSSSTSTPNGVTGTDPEPIEPDTVGLILTILRLA